MKADPELMFECLIYINAYYYPVYAVSEAVMTLAKYMSEKKDTPNLGQDAIVCFSRIFMDLFKILLFNRFKETCRSKSSLNDSSRYHVIRQNKYIKMRPFNVKYRVLIN
nr:unnamed protein product [Callosobruchus chinensis]